MKNLKVTKDYKVIFRNQVHIYYSHKGKAFRHNLKINEKEQNTRENVLMINTKVEKLKSIIYDYNLTHSTNPPIEYLKSKFFTTEINKTDVLLMFDSFLKEIQLSGTKKKKNIKPQSVAPYEALKNNITDYIVKENYTSLDEKFVEDFINFLSSKNYSYSYDTIRKKSVYFGSFIAYLKKNKIISFEPEINLVEKIVINKNVETLTKDELNYLINERTKNTEYSKVIDFFLFQCFTSLRYSDLRQISKNKISKNLLKIVSQKTGANLSIYLNDVLKEIMINNNYDFTILPYHKYKAQLYEMFKEFAEDKNKLPSLNQEIELTIQKGNEVINETKKRFELLGTHTGRRVFITIQIRLNTSFADIMKMTGHKSLELLQEYLDIYNSEKANEKENITDKMLKYLQS